MLAPVIVLTAGAVGVLMLVGIDHRTIGAGHPEGDTINLLNNVVTGMVALFAAVMVVNAFAAVVAGRRTELQRLRLLGATPTQVERSVVAEAAIVAGIGVALGPGRVAGDGRAVRGRPPRGHRPRRPALAAAAAGRGHGRADPARRPGPPYDGLGPLSGVVR